MNVIKVNRKKLNYSKKIIMFLVLLLLVACGNPSEEAYNSAIQKGLDVIASENYEKAEAYFELALEEKPEDKKATAYLNQTEAYNRAKKAMDSNDLKTAEEEAKKVVKIKNGSKSLSGKAMEIIDKIKAFDSTLLGFQKEYEAIKGLIASNSFDEAKERIASVLNNDEINEVYYENIKLKLDELKANIGKEVAQIKEQKQLKIEEQIEAEEQLRAEALAVGPPGDEILPNITNGGLTYDDLRYTNQVPLEEWRNEIEHYYDKDIENVSNQEIYDYLLNTYGSGAEQRAKRVADSEAFELAEEEEKRANAEYYFGLGVESFNQGKEDEVWSNFIQGSTQTILEYPDLKAQAYDILIQTEFYNDPGTASFIDSLYGE